MNIAQIRYFVTAAQLQNLSRAAESLHLSQPSLSRSIAKLEEELGAPLFERRGKKVLLNPQGARFLSSARVILRELDSALLDLREHSAGASARVVVGVFESDGLITPCLTAFARAHPEVEYELNCSIEGEDPLDINKYDMLLYPDYSRYSKFRGVFLQDEPYLLCVGAAHPLVTRPQVLPQELARLPFVFIRREGGYIEEPYYLCAGLNLHLKTLCFTDAREQHLQLVASGAALGFVPEGCAAPYRENPRVRLVRVGSAKFSRRMLLCFKRQKHLSPMGQVLRAFAMDYFQLPPPQNTG